LPQATSYSIQHNTIYNVDWVVVDTISRVQVYESFKSLPELEFVFGGEKAGGPVPKYASAVLLVGRTSRERGRGEERKR
jgi:hypothetical protein